jgi:hypothetical protein
MLVLFYHVKQDVLRYGSCYFYTFLEAKNDENSSFVDRIVVNNIFFFSMIAVSYGSNLLDIHKNYSEKGLL